MMMEGAFDPADRMDSTQARRLMRRAAGMLRPYRREVIAAVILVFFYTGSILVGPFFVKYGIDQGISKGDYSALNKAAAAYVVVAFASYFIYRSQVMMIAKAG